MEKSYFICGKYKLDLSKKTYVMGVLNVTPDSFSDGNEFFNEKSAFKKAGEMIKDGADIIDIGGESTRPGSDPVSAEEEIRRIMPVLKKLVKEFDVPVSIDTYKTEVAAAALNEGASVINDISGLHFSPGIAPLVAGKKAGLILMHILGTPKFMQAEPKYKNIVSDISKYLKEGLTTALESGIRKENIIIDPGIGFGKSLEHNLLVLKRLKEFTKLGFPLLIGPSRKSFIGKLTGLPEKERLEGTIASVVISVMNNASIVRVHDVKEICRALKVADAVIKA